MVMQINDDVEETGQRGGCRDLLGGRLGTLPEWRRHGLGAAGIDHTVDWLHQGGTWAMTSQSRITPAGQRWLPGGECGWQQCGRQKKAVPLLSIDRLSPFS